MSLQPNSHATGKKPTPINTLKKNTYLYAFQLVRKMSFTACLFFAASGGNRTKGFWIRALSALDAHASATTDVRSDQETMATLV